VEIPRHWRLKKQRYGLVGEVCLKCDEKLFPPKPSHKCAEVIVYHEVASSAYSSSKLPLYTLSSYMVEQKKQQPELVQ